jgi:hypothetical protein
VPVRPAAAALTILLASASPALAQTAPPNPTPSHIQRALKNAARSLHLWATVNICNTRHYRDKLGIRAQMPALGFPSQLSVTIGVDYWSSAQKQFRAIPAFKKQRLVLGTFSSGDQQGGTTFTFAPHSGLLRGHVTFVYKRAGKVLGSITRTTTGHHKHVDQAHPPGYSAATCTIK